MTLEGKYMLRHMDEVRGMVLDSSEELALETQQLWQRHQLIAQHISCRGSSSGRQTLQGQRRAEEGGPGVSGGALHRLCASTASCSQ